MKFIVVVKYSNESYIGFTVRTESPIGRAELLFNTYLNFVNVLSAQAT